MAQPQHYPQADVIAFIEGFERRWHDGRIRGARDYKLAFVNEAEERFPGLTIQAVHEASGIVLRRQAEEDARLDREVEQNQQVGEVLAAIWKRHGFPADMKVGEGLRRAAAKHDGDANEMLRATAARDALPETRLFRALFRAAAEAHPAWAIEEDGRISQDESLPGPADEHALIAWFKRERAAEAAAITDRIMDGRA